MSAEEHDPKKEIMSTEGQGRRDFLKSAGKFAVLTPPAVTMLLSTTMSSDAIASSGGKPLDLPPGNKHWSKGDWGHKSWDKHWGKWDKHWDNKPWANKNWGQDVSNRVNHGKLKMKSISREGRGSVHFHFGRKEP